MKKFLLAFLFVGVAVSAFAQAPVVNPAKVQWDYQDPTGLVRYDLGYFIGNAAEPFWQTPVNFADVRQVGTIRYESNLPRPVFGNFTARLRAVGVQAASTTEIVSAWSAPSNPFSFLPPVPANLAAVP